MNAKIFIAGLVVVAALFGAYYIGVHQAKAPTSQETISDDLGGTDQIAEDEHAYQGDNRITAAQGALVGNWQSNEDSKFSREFKADGTLIDAYEGSPAPQKGTWSLSTKEAPDSAYQGTYEQGPVYLKISVGQDVLFFKITAVTPDALELIYLDHGGALTFKKI
jgi:hypothetical protein